VKTTLDLSKWEQLEYNRRQNENGSDGWWCFKGTNISKNYRRIINTSLGSKRLFFKEFI